MSAWYRVRWGKIVPVEVERTTDNFVWLVGSKHREAKHSEWNNYFPTLEAAKTCAERTYYLKAEAARREAARALDEYQKVCAAHTLTPRPIGGDS